MDFIFSFPIRREQIADAYIIYIEPISVLVYHINAPGPTKIGSARKMAQTPLPARSVEKDSLAVFVSNLPSVEKRGNLLPRLRSA